ncbi:sigma-54-dependent Fis family transcriptional regulator [Clostridium sp. MSJ-4]|uniref:Sigma-54-dependent Fis family transcriptional regulator n=1 Tax=Clostridium simiarum TaxID=2841506 RepID=A0ABS6F3T6_9CLOT|nr:MULTISPECIES: sigma-54-dependent Fis family transcriptional regulator [Clostridium]MBU5592923.1 sigma-54-dependent Fis family transcriptional regulator [Clostridium simiarum]
MNNIMINKEFIQFCYAVFDELPIAVDILDKEGKIIYINKTFSDFLKKPREELIGKLVTEANPTSKFLDTLHRKQAEIACKHRFDNGNEAIVHRIPIMDDDGKLMGGFGMVVFEDISKLQEVMDKYRVLDKELKLYKNEIAKLNIAKYNLDDIIGRSQEISKCKNKVKKMARVKSNVLVIGESGVGKELFAHSIHNESNRKDKAFISVNCSAIPENLMESEFFGYEDGSFTGARKGGNIGKFQLANGGTIFLDEIGEMPLHLQAKLLRVLQEKEVQPIGAKSPLKVDVRVISATHKNLLQLVNDGKFREDLYYRLNVLTLEIPPIRERRVDIPELIDKFLGLFYRETGMYRNVPKNIMDILVNYDWPGNVRELRNIVEKICVNADDVNISIADLPPYLINRSMKSKVVNKTSGNLKDILDSVEKEIIINTLRECNYNKSETSKKLNIPRASLYRKLEEYGIDVKM